MQEEKNNNNGAEVKKNNHKPPKKKGYFIAPPKGNSEGAPAPQPTGNTAEKAHGGNGNGEQKKHRPHHRKHPQKQNDAKKDAPEAAVTSAPVEEKRSEAIGEPSPKRNNRKKNKNKRKPDAPAVEEAAAKPVEQKPAQPNAKRSQNNEGNRSRQAFKDIKAPINHSADDYEEYKLVVEDEPTSGVSAEEENAPKTEVVGIRFKSTGKIYYFAPNGITLKKGSSAIVDTARGQEFGEVAMANSFVRSSDIVPPLRSVIRAATEHDVEHNKVNKQKEADAFRICTEKIHAHKLDMKLIDAQYTFDNSKLLFYFTSSERVDFRELVKDLAGVFRTRIELRQIGIRDEAKLMGGLGMCGRPLCCTLFLSDFDQVSIKMAKEQNLSLNSAKISGICGRLMCCLKYEHEAYEYEIKRTPPVDSLVRTENGDGIVTEISPLAGTIKVRLLASPEVPPKVYKRDEVTMLRKKQNPEKKADKN